jgi:hypothetical protein
MDDDHISRIEVFQLQEELYKSYFVGTIYEEEENDTNEGEFHQDKVYITDRFLDSHTRNDLLNDLDPVDNTRDNLFGLFPLKRVIINGYRSDANIHFFAKYFKRLGYVRCYVNGNADLTFFTGYRR